ncbi:hypothetical protein AB0F96_27075 [Streptomyces sp. NPDC023998]|uniref:hypothetical protein n=1 Tax=Streptomyces sp. NPDC023998 TaxID=3154597 RepID=UPI0033F13DA8
MATKKRKGVKPTSPLVRVPVRVGRIDASGLVGDLRNLHENADDKDVERMPADTDLYGALLYVESHAEALDDESDEVRGAAAVKRALLWEYLREQADVHQLVAIDDARAANVEWAGLVSALGVRSPSAAYNKAQRLRAVSLTDPSSVDGRPVRRTPEAVSEMQRRIAAAAAAERRREEAARKRHTLILPVARRLVENREGLAPDEDADDWLDEVTTLLKDCRTPTQKVSLERYVAAAVRSLKKWEQNTARPAAVTPEAQLALAAATELLQD